MKPVFTAIKGERKRTYAFPGGATVMIENVTAICVRPTSHRLETKDGRKFIVPGKFISIEIDASGWSV
jgi:hypothetical protein